MASDPLLSVAAIAQWGEATGITHLMTMRWSWPIAEVLHFIGLSLLFGTVGFLDLRLIGMARGIPLDALRRFLPLGTAGFAISACTGLLFVATFPDQYLYNPALQSKLGLVIIAGLNMVLFHATVARRAWATPANQQAPISARLFGLVSLTCWLGVITCGRVITAFRPPFHWCAWCN